MGVSTKVIVQLDATAAEGMLQRRGLGRLRHIDVQELWGQEAIKKGMFEIQRVASKENTSDIGTKPMQRETLEYHLSNMGDYHPECHHPLP